MSKLAGARRANEPRGRYVLSVKGSGRGDNAINAIRLLLAVLVLISHTGAISGIAPLLPVDSSETGPSTASS